MLFGTGEASTSGHPGMQSMRSLHSNIDCTPMMMKTHSTRPILPSLNASYSKGQRWPIGFPDPLRQADRYSKLEFASQEVVTQASPWLILSPRLEVTTSSGFEHWALDPVVENMNVSSLRHTVAVSQHIRDTTQRNCFLDQIHDALVQAHTEMPSGKLDVDALTTLDGMIEVTDGNATYRSVSIGSRNGSYSSDGPCR